MSTEHSECLQLFVNKLKMGNNLKRLTREGKIEDMRKDIKFGTRSRKGQDVGRGGGEKRPDEWISLGKKQDDSF